jgi:hypothetical protein
MVGAEPGLQWKWTTLGKRRRHREARDPLAHCRTLLSGCGPSSGLRRARARPDEDHETIHPPDTVAGEEPNKAKGDAGATLLNGPASQAGGQLTTPTNIS